MKTTWCPSRLRRRLIAVAIGSTLTGCSSHSPTQPSDAGPTLLAITLDLTNLSVGASAQGTVTLTSPAPAGGVTVDLVSTSPSVLRAPSTVVVGEGESSAAFAASAMSAGTARITGTLNGSTRASQNATVSAAQVVALLSITLSAESVVGGDIVTGTATLTGAAPAGGAVVQLTSVDPVSTRRTVTVEPGVVSASFVVTTRAVGGNMSGTVTGSYGGVSSTVTLAVTRPTVATARFGVRGPSESDTCTLQNGGSTLDCVFDGTMSTAPGTLTMWAWTWGVSKSLAQTTASGLLARPPFDCSMLPPPPLPPSRPFLALTVTLVVHDDMGNVSAPAVYSNIRVLPLGACGY